MCSRPQSLELLSFLLNIKFLCHIIQSQDVWGKKMTSKFMYLTQIYSSCNLLHFLKWQPYFHFSSWKLWLGVIFLFLYNTCIHNHYILLLLISKYVQNLTTFHYIHSNNPRQIITFTWIILIASYMVLLNPPLPHSHLCLS